MWLHCEDEGMRERKNATDFSRLENPYEPMRIKREQFFSLFFFGTYWNFARISDIQT